MAAGLLRLVRAVTLRAGLPFRIVVAVLEITVGIAIVSDPHIGYATLAILAGIWLIIDGIGTIALGLAMRSVRPGLASTSS